VKDIILWQSIPAREREKQYLSQLSVLHQSTAPPRELSQRIPRTLRWKRSPKLIVGFDVAILVLAISVTIWCSILATRLHNDLVRDIRRGNEHMRHYATQATDPVEKAKAEKSLREGEEFERKWHGLYFGMLTGIFLGAFVGPVVHVCVDWFAHIRPELILLSRGIPVCATVVSKRHWLVVMQLEVGFTTERGESIRKKQVLHEKEASLFQAGGSVWMLYLPLRPKMARIYGLKSSLAEVTAS
jgi:hypothetical protein